jgi:hypothetical protein
VESAKSAMCSALIQVDQICIQRGPFCYTNQTPYALKPNSPTVAEEEAISLTCLKCKWLCLEEEEQPNKSKSCQLVCRSEVSYKTRIHKMERCKSRPCMLRKRRALGRVRLCSWQTVSEELQNG